MCPFVNPVECLFVWRLKLKILICGEATNFAIHPNFCRWFQRAGEKLYLRFVQHALWKLSENLGQFAKRPHRHAANCCREIWAGWLTSKKKSLCDFRAICKRTLDAPGKALRLGGQLLRFGICARSVVIDPSDIPMLDLN